MNKERAKKIQADLFKVLDKFCAENDLAVFKSKSRGTFGEANVKFTFNFIENQKDVGGLSFIDVLKSESCHLFNFIKLYQSVEKNTGTIMESPEQLAQFYGYGKAGYFEVKPGYGRLQQIIDYKNRAKKSPIVTLDIMTKLNWRHSAINFKPVDFDKKLKVNDKVVAVLFEDDEEFAYTGVVLKVSNASKKVKVKFDFDKTVQVCSMEHVAKFM